MNSFTVNYIFILGTWVNNCCFRDSFMFIQLKKKVQMQWKCIIVSHCSQKKRKKNPNAFRELATLNINIHVILKTETFTVNDSQISHTNPKLTPHWTSVDNSTRNTMLPGARVVTQLVHVWIVLGHNGDGVTLLAND